MTSPSPWVQQSRVDKCDVDRNDPQTESFDAVVSTIPVTDLVEMLGPEIPSDSCRAAAARLRYLANILVYALVDRPLANPNQWLYFPHDAVIFNRGYVPANFDPSSGQPQKHLLCLEVTCFPGDATWARSDEELGQRVRDGLERVGLAQAAHPGIPQTAVAGEAMDQDDASLAACAGV